jgi:hypothetical protein
MPHANHLALQLIDHTGRGLLLELSLVPIRIDGLHIAMAFAATLGVLDSSPIVGFASIVLHCEHR